MFGAQSFGSQYFAEGAISLDATVVVTGVAATTAIGTVVVTADANVTPTGVSATSAIGTTTEVADSLIVISGVSATTGIGTVIASGTGDVTIIVAGILMLMQLGQVSFPAIAALNLGSPAGKPGGHVWKLQSDSPWPDEEQIEQLLEPLRPKPAPQPSPPVVAADEPAPSTPPLAPLPPFKFPDLTPRLVRISQDGIATPQGVAAHFTVSDTPASVSVVAVPHSPQVDFTAEEMFLLFAAVA